MTATWEIREGRALDRLREMGDESVHCCITSPPYFGLRDYGIEGQIGLEETPGEFVEALVAVFREVRRVLRKDGTLWVNLGDSYCTQPQGSPSKTSGLSNPERQHGLASQVSAHRANRRPRWDGFKPKDLLGIPWRVAFALQADGWWLRSDIIWSKPCGQPEAVRDRPTKMHEYLFLLSRSSRYFYDYEAIREESDPELGAHITPPLEVSEPLRVHRGHPALVALAVQDRQPAGRPFDVLQFEAERLVDPQAGSPHRDDHRLVPDAARMVPERFEDRVNLVRGEDLRRQLLALVLGRHSAPEGRKCAGRSRATATVVQDRTTGQAELRNRSLVSAGHGAMALRVHAGVGCSNTRRPPICGEQPILKAAPAGVRAPQPGPTGGLRGQSFAPCFTNHRELTGG